MKPRHDRPRARATPRPATPRGSRIRIVVAEGCALDRQALAALLSGQRDFEVVGQAAGSAEAIERCSRLRPAVLLLALDLPDESGEGALPRIRAALPGLRVLALSGRGAADCLVLNPPGRERLSGHLEPRRRDEETDCLQLARAQGALGTLRRSAAPEALFRAVRAVAAGQASFEPCGGPAPGAPGRFGLSPRELEVAVLLAEGRSNRDVARSLGISEPTVKKHVGRVLAKLNVQDRLQAGLFVARRPLLFTQR